MNKKKKKNVEDGYLTLTLTTGTGTRTFGKVSCIKYNLLLKVKNKRFNKRRNKFKRRKIRLMRNLHHLQKRIYNRKP